MEIISLFLGLAVLGFIINVVTSAGKAAMGKGSFKDNMHLQLNGMQAFEVRLIDSTLNDDGTGTVVKEIEGRGLFALTHNTNVAFVTSVFDNTSGELVPVISVIDGFREPGSTVYQHTSAMGEIGPDQGFMKWVRIGVVIPTVLEPPYGGSREMKVIVRMVNADNLPNIRHGYHTEEDTGIICQHSLEFNYEFEGKGYREASLHKEEAVGLSLKIGMAVAMADGSLDDEEGNVLRSWIVKSIEPYSNDKKANLKILYNEAMRDSYALAKDGSLSLSDLTKRMNEIGETTSKYEAIELCFEVMAADGIADESEINTIKQVSMALNLDADEVAKMRDQKIIGLNTSVGSQASIETLLGIEPEWSADRTMKHLRIEFQKWNNRLNILGEGEERENAQIMLDRIAEARKKYAA